ncbi:MAG: calcium-binding protein, partial [Rhizobiaceae bacterium]
LRGLLTTGQDLSGGVDTIVVYGNIGNDTLRLSFAASAYGGLGDDTYYIRSGVPFAATGSRGIFEYAGEGVDTAYISVANYTLNDHVENMIGMLTTGQTLTGGSTDNVITGNIGNDTLNGGGGADTLIGGLGDDTYIVDALDTIIENPGEGTDTVRTSIASYTLSANLENLVGTAASGQWLIGNELANAITGTAGNDIIDGRAGADAMNGGAGNDIYYIDDIGDTLQDASGVDEVRTALATYNLGSTYYTGAIIENLTGISATGQYLIGTHLANIITGGIGGDIIDGRDGADTMIGGEGNDRYLVDIAGDVVIELAGQGIDEVVTALGSYRLGENLENLIGISSSGQWLAGNALSNTLTGGNGNDVLEGGAGVDSMWGNGGNDRYLVDDALDRVHEQAGGGTDEVLSYIASYRLEANVENMIGMLTTGQTLIGNELGNVLTGNSGNDVLDGAAGADSLWGYEGDDIYYVDNSGDMVHESSGQG